jgi:hypothetical protein
VVKRWSSQLGSNLADEAPAVQILARNNIRSFQFLTGNIKATFLRSDSTLWIIGKLRVPGSASRGAHPYLLALHNFALTVAPGFATGRGSKF